jgi:hypothetical protein
MKSRLLICASLLLALCRGFGAEIPFDKSDEFPASAYGLIAEKQVVWFGEMHGTRQAPELFLGLVRLVSSHDTAPPVVALEIPTTEQRAIDRYLASGDDAFLRSSTFFTSEVKDGRSSVALVRLLSQLRTEKKATVFCFDSAVAKTPQERDTAMSENLRRCAKKFPHAKLVILSGNIHARVVEGTSWDPTYRPAAFELSKQLGSLVSFVLVYEAGTMWARTESGFGEQKVKGDHWSGTAAHYITLYPERTRGHDGAIFTEMTDGEQPAVTVRSGNASAGIRSRSICGRTPSGRFPARAAGTMSLSMTRRAACMFPMPLKWKFWMPTPSNLWARFRTRRASMSWHPPMTTRQPAAASVSLWSP